MDDVLEMSEVSRVFGSSPNEITALRGASLVVSAGELVAVTGPSGSGKTTLLSIAGGIEQPSSGKVAVEGIDLTAADATELARMRRQRIGLVFQQYNLLRGLTALENVAAPLELDGVASRQARHEALEALTTVGLGDRAVAFPDELSGGQQQRVAIARGLIGGRRLLLADEPTGALDRATGRDVLALFRDACTAGAAVVVVTHDREVAQRADREIHMADGRVVGEEAS